MIKNALRSDGLLVNVKDANKGLQCNLMCSCCNEPVVAKQGQQKEWHFAHVSGNECQYAVESELHHLAKKIIARNRQLKIPHPFEFFNHEKKRYELGWDYRLVGVSDVSLEKVLGDIVPDIICKVGGMRFAVEIFVTHKIDSIKEWKINDIGLITLEINLSNVDRHIDELLLNEILVGKGVDYLFRYFCNNKHTIIKHGIDVKNKILEDTESIASDFLSDRIHVLSETRTSLLRKCEMIKKEIKEAEETLNNLKTALAPKPSQMAIFENK